MQLLPKFKFGHFGWPFTSTPDTGKPILSKIGTVIYYVALLYFLVSDSPINVQIQKVCCQLEFFARQEVISMISGECAIQISYETITGELIGLATRGHFWFATTNL